MIEKTTRRRSLEKLGQTRNRPSGGAGGDLVRSRPLLEAGDLPLLVSPALRGVDLIEWARENRPWIEDRLRHHGGILFRGFGLSEASDLERFVEAVAETSLEYRERSSPRRAVAGRIYTSTDYPPSYPIFLHNENSYQSTWPMKIFFFCHTPAESRGETPLADTRGVYRRIDPQVRERFSRDGWMYVRNFGDGFGLDWRTVFQTESREEVEEHCRRSGIGFEWREGDRLRTRAVRRAVAEHPETGEPVWFNHATFFHVTTLEPPIREALLAEFEESDLPSNTYYGDGTPIEAEVLDHLRDCYRAETVLFPWERGDLLLLDNMMCAHGRSPFTGERKILVGMASPMSWDRI